jgi:hypothetical protein
MPTCRLVAARLIVLAAKQCEYRPGLTGGEICASCYFSGISRGKELKEFEEKRQRESDISDEWVNGRNCVVLCTRVLGDKEKAEGG